MPIVCTILLFIPFKNGHPAIPLQKKTIFEIQFK